MEVIRTIHPVGQGAFYSERFMDDGKQIALVVYDCGSKNINYLESEISSFFSEYNTIDVLFISHFDDDHINGITKLKELGIKINTVAIPLIDKNDKWFYICTSGTLARDAINNPKSFFDADNVIQINTVEEDLPYEDWRPFIIEKDQRIDAIIPSGRPISLNAIYSYWIYIPFNFQEDKRRAKLISAIKEKGLLANETGKIEELLNDDDFIKDHYAEINNIYKTVCTDGANRCSLIIYSGAIVESHISLRYPLTRRRLKHLYLYDYNYMFNRYNRDGCLYLGDTDLNQGRGRWKILNHLRNALNLYVNRIGIIQLPHHGAVKNYNKSLLTLNDNGKLFFASFGSTNKYGHPAYNIIEQIVYDRNFFYGVSERRDSSLIEIIHM